MTETPAGWYPDVTADGTLRWWDGQQWTEHRAAPTAPAVAPEALVRVGNGKTELVATATHITLKGETFALAELDGVQYTGTRRFVNGSYMGTNYTISVRAGERKQSFLMGTNHKEVGLDQYREAYVRIATLLDDTVCRRLAADIAGRVAAGETVTLGPAGARLELAAAGWRPKKPGGKVVPWELVTGTHSEGGRVWILQRKAPGAEPKKHGSVGYGGWNAVVVPFVVDLLRRG